LRIAICSAGELYGGVEQFIYLYAQHLQTSKHADVLVILFHDGQLNERLEDAGIETHVVRCRFKYDPRAVRDVNRILASRRVDVVHTHGYRANVICALAPALLGIPVVKTEHGILEVSCRTPLKSLRMHLNSIADQLVTLAFASRIIYVSSDLASRLRTIHRLKKTTIIHNAIAPIPLSPTTPSEPFERRHFNIGIVGRVSKVKGHLFLIKAVQRLSDLVDLRVHVIGNGPLERELREYCIANGIESRVRFWGFREDIHELMRHLDILVMPSLHEGLPYTALEAMYLRIPIIASAVGGLREVLRNDETAILVPPGDCEKLAGAIRRLHDDPSRRQTISERALAHVTSELMIDRMTRRYIGVYQAALPRAASRRQNA
jgi:glycosyltransferase involved in cell wall biosynthesis